MSNEIVLSNPYPCAEAERGKFATLNQNWLTANGYPAVSGTSQSARGRYAVLTYQVNNEVTVASGTALPVEFILPNAIFVTSIPVSASTAYHITAPVGITPRIIEVKNTSSSKTMYFLISDAAAVSYSDIAFYGLPIEAYGFYSVETAATSFWVGASSDISSVRVYGHYKQ